MVWSVDEMKSVIRRLVIVLIAQHLISVKERTIVKEEIILLVGKDALLFATPLPILSLNNIVHLPSAVNALKDMKYHPIKMPVYKPTALLLLLVYKPTPFAQLIRVQRMDGQVLYLQIQMEILETM